MADELRRLEELNERLRLVGRGNDTAERQRYCSAFTQEAARMLFGEGWRRIRKTEGQNVDGMDIDKLVQIGTFRLVDIIVNAGIESARVGFSDVGTFTDTSRFIEVRPIEVPPPPQAPSAPSPIPADDALLEQITNLVDARDLTNHELDRIATALEKILKLLVGAAGRFGIGA